MINSKLKIKSKLFVVLMCILITPQVERPKKCIPFGSQHPLERHSDSNQLERESQAPGRRPIVQTRTVRNLL